MSKLTTLIRFKDAWLTGNKLEPGITLLAKIGFINIETITKNDKGDGYLVSGYVDISATIKDRTEQP